MDIFEVDKLTEETTPKLSSILDTFRFKYQMIVNCIFINFDNEEMNNDELFERLVSTNLNIPQVREDLFVNDHNGLIHIKIQNFETKWSSWNFQRIVDV